MDCRSMKILFLLCCICSKSTYGMNAVVKLRQAAVFRHNHLEYDCHYGQLVEKCHWRYNGASIDPSEFGLRYKYNNGFNSYDCSLEIHNMTLYENSRPNQINFECEAMPKLTPLIVRIGDFVHLPCFVNRPVNCVWKRNGQVMGHDENYRYLSRGVNSEDCTLIIRNISPSDLTLWECRIQEQLQLSNPEILAHYNLALANKSWETTENVKLCPPVFIDRSSQFLIVVCAFELVIIILISAAFVVYINGISRNFRRPAKKRSTIKKKRKVSATTSNSSSFVSFISETAEIHSPLYELMRMGRTDGNQVTNSSKNTRRITLPRVTSSKFKKTRSSRRIPSYLDLH